APEPLKGLNIAVVDDQNEAREVLGESLRDAGAQVGLFSSGTAIVQAVAESTLDQWPDLLICDITLGDTDGYRVIGKIRRLEAERHIPLADRMPAVALSGHTAAEDRLYALLAGFQVYMAKPVDSRELVATALGLTRGGPPAPAAGSRSGPQ